MKNSGAQAAMASWQADGHALRVEYTLGLMAELRAAVVDGFHRMTHGGLEVGGVLFGSRDGDTIRIADWRPISCRHARGPSFSLVPEDEEELAGLLQKCRNEPALEGLLPVGWFHSHTRRAICLLEDDLALYDRFFPEAWQVALVIQPSKAGATRAGFFFRESGGRMRTDSTYGEFEIEALPVRVAAPRAPALVKAPAQVHPPDAGPARLVPAAATPDPSAEIEVEPPRLALTPQGNPRVWWTLLLVFGCALAGFGGNFLADRFMPSPDLPLALRVRDNAGQLEVEWDRSGRSLASAEQGKLVVADGDANSEIALDPQALRSGHFTYARRSGQVKVRLILLKKGNPLADEITQFVGPPADNRAEAELQELRKKNDELESDNRRLADEAKREGARADSIQQQYYKLLKDRLQEERTRGRR